MSDDRNKQFEDYSRGKAGEDIYSDAGRAGKAESDAVRQAWKENVAATNRSIFPVTSAKTGMPIQQSAASSSRSSFGMAKLFAIVGACLAIVYGSSDPAVGTPYLTLAFQGALGGLILAALLYVIGGILDFTLRILAVVLRWGVIAAVIIGVIYIVGQNQ